MFLIRPPNREKTKCCAVMTHICTKMKQKGATTNEKWSNFQNLISKSGVVHFSVKLKQLYFIQAKNYFNNFLEYVELV